VLPSGHGLVVSPHVSLITCQTPARRSISGWPLGVVTSSLQPATAKRTRSTVVSPSLKFTSISQTASVLFTQTSGSPNVGFTCQVVWRGPGASQVRDKRLCRVEAHVRLSSWAPEPDEFSSALGPQTSLPDKDPNGAATTAKNQRCFQNILKAEAPY